MDIRLCFQKVAKGNYRATEHALDHTTIVDAAGVPSVGDYIGKDGHRLKIVGRQWYLGGDHQEFQESPMVVILMLDDDDHVLDWRG